ncbi:MAG TPA: lipoprotein [Steroidobacteraceae bacterium]|nr:lipoprotein [Steroidobacteraceae bacterium]
MKHGHPAWLASAALLALLAGCGQKGALYLPDKKPAPVTAPATAPPPAAQPAAAPAPPKKSDSDKSDDSQPPQ